jgi:hypothetical protein
LYERFQKGLWPLVGRAQRMEPESHFPFAEEVGEILAKAQLPAPDRLSATPTFGAAAGGWCEQMRHRPSIIQVEP